MAIADTFTGTDGSEILTGSIRDDRIFALAGNDTLLGGIGGDFLDGGRGSDVLHGGTGNDRLTGNAGPESFVGGAGTDTIRSGSGNDRINARDGRRDTVSCGPRSRLGARRPHRSPHRLRAGLPLAQGRGIVAAPPRAPRRSPGNVHKPWHAPGHTTSLGFSTKTVHKPGHVSRTPA